MYLPASLHTPKRALVLNIAHLGDFAADSAGQRFTIIAAHEKSVGKIPLSRV